MDKYTKLLTWSGVAGIVVVASAINTWASFAYQAPEVALDQAEAVVIGTMTQVDAEKGTGSIQVKEVIKGDKNLKSIPARFSARPKPRKITTKDGKTRIMMAPRMCGAAYRKEGQSGIWVLGGKDKNKRYWVTGPRSFLPVNQLPKVKSMLAKLAKRQWTKPVDGLSLSIVIHRMGNDVSYLAYTVFRNTGDKPLRIPTRADTASFKLILNSPGGKAKTIFDTRQLRLMRQKASSRQKILQPGQSAYIFSTYGINLGRLDETGKYIVEATYENHNDGSKIESKPTKHYWTGSLKAEATFKVDKVQLRKHALKPQKAISTRAPLETF